MISESPPSPPPSPFSSAMPRSIACALPAGRTAPSCGTGKEASTTCRAHGKGTSRRAYGPGSRVAIVSLASLGALSVEGVEAPVSWLSNRPVDEQLCFFAGAAIVEAAATLPRFEGLLSLRDDVRPGVFFVQEEKEEEGSADPFAERVEDWAGRVAMLAAAGALISGVV